MVTAPHCDPRVLHAPGECRFCDAHPEWQEARRLWGIAFTGQESDQEGEGPDLPCPSDLRRGTGGAHVWYGNRPTPEGQPLHTPWVQPEHIESSRTPPQPIRARVHRDLSTWRGALRHFALPLLGWGLVALAAAALGLWSAGAFR